MKKILIVFSILFVLIIITIVALFMLKEKTEEKTVLMVISDVSKKCLSNVVTIYSNGEYLVRTGTDQEKQRGKLNYSGNLENLVDIIKTYEPDMSTLMNYKIELSDGDVVYAAIKNAKKLNELLDSIPLDNLFWCE